MKIIEETEIRYFYPNQDFIFKEEFAFRNVNKNNVQSVEYYTIIFCNDTVDFITRSSNLHIFTLN